MPQPVPTRRAPRPREVRGLVVPLGRVALLCSIVWLIHDAQQRRAAATAAVGRPTVPDELLSDLFGVGARWKADEGIVVDAAGSPIGLILQTSPAADHIVGFSGPTNLVIACDMEQRIVGVRVLSSGDTKDHVRQVVEDEAFLASFAGRDTRSTTGLVDIDAVSGATLTSLAMIESVIVRLGGGLGSLKFPETPTVDDVRPLFPDAAALIADTSSSSWWDVFDAEQRRLGGLLRTVPAADNVIGYQGPTETLIGFDSHERIIGFTLGRSYDNEPYVGYVREDTWYGQSFNGRTLSELSTLDLTAAGVEGVSGATMTSLAVAEGMVLAAAQRQDELTARHSVQPTASFAISARNWGTLGVLVAGLILGLSPLRGNRWLRRAFQVVLVGYLGFVNGDLISQAMLVGWAQHGIAWRSMCGVLLLTIAAFVVPITLKSNIYCHHLCPHGAVQQWLRPTRRRHRHVPRSWHRLMSVIPGVLLVLVVAVGMGAVSISLVDIEPFDAYLLAIAGTATIMIALVGLLASAFVPMAYCRYGCPTGALLEYVRRHARSDRLTRRDGVAVLCLLLAWLLR